MIYVLETRSVEVSFMYEILVHFKFEERIFATYSGKFLFTTKLLVSNIV